MDLETIKEIEEILKHTTGYGEYSGSSKFHSSYFTTRGAGYETEADAKAAIATMPEYAEFLTIYTPWAAKNSKYFIVPSYEKIATVMRKEVREKIEVLLTAKGVGTGEQPLYDLRTDGFDGKVHPCKFHVEIGYRYGRGKVKIYSDKKTLEFDYTRIVTALLERVEADRQAKKQSAIRTDNATKSIEILKRLVSTLGGIQMYGGKDEITSASTLRGENFSLRASTNDPDKINFSVEALELTEKQVIELVTLLRSFEENQ